MAFPVVRRTLARPRELTLGIVGLGRIGKRMAHISAKRFKRVVAFDPYLIDGDFPSYVERAPRWKHWRAAADVVSLHTPLNDADPRHHRRAIRSRAMRRAGYLVNTARGAVVDVDAVLAALDTWHCRGAALDVLPVRAGAARGRGCSRHPRVILTPHAAFYSVEAERELRRKAAQNLVTLARHRTARLRRRAGTRTPDRRRQPHAHRPERAHKTQRAEEHAWQASPSPECTSTSARPT